jgi:hypothetical protein
MQEVSAAPAEPHRRERKKWQTRDPLVLAFDAFAEQLVPAVAGHWG